MKPSNKQSTIIAKMNFNFFPKMFVVLVIILNLIVTSSSKMCGEYNSKDIDVCDFNSFNQVKKWWEKMAIKKPFECKFPSGWKKHSPKWKFFGPKYPVVSYKCGVGENPIPYSFSGSFKDGLLNGIGKLKIGKPHITDDISVCLKANQVLGSTPKEIVGTFVNGLLHGNAKITLLSGEIVLANYVDGLSDGLRREWNIDGILTFVGFYQAGIKTGKTFSRKGNIFFL